MSRTYPDKLEIRPLTKPPNATIRVPGSKSITNRALVLAAMSDTERGCQLEGVLQSEDTEVMVECLRSLGFDVQVDWPMCSAKVRKGPSLSPVPAIHADLFTANSGTTIRFLTALVCLGFGHYRLDGVMRMRERPINDLLMALRQLGATIRCEQIEGYPPVVVEARGLDGGYISVRGDVSSQYLSALLMVAPLAKESVTINVEGPLVSRPYVDMTVRMMRDFGVFMESDDVRYYRIPTVRAYRRDEYSIEPDASAASYWFAAGAVTGGRITIPGLAAGGLQGDIKYVDSLEDMGCRVTRDENGIHIEGLARRGIEADMNAISDTVMTLAAVACFAEGPTTIRNVAHIRHKETDRIAAISTELRRLGAEVEEFPDGLRITPRRLHAAEVETYNDHRMAMSLALIGLCVPGVVIKNPGCVAKTYPGYWDDFQRLYE